MDKQEWRTLRRPVLNLHFDKDQVARAELCVACSTLAPWVGPRILAWRALHGGLLGTDGLIGCFSSLFCTDCAAQLVVSLLEHADVGLDGGR